MSKSNIKVYGVSIFLERNGKFLAVARRNNPEHFGMAGGKIDAGETPEEAAIRECKEETGLTLSNPVLIWEGYCGKDYAMTFSGDFSGEAGTQEGEPECRWVEKEMLFGPPFGEYNRQVFEKLGLL